MKFVPNLIMREAEFDCAIVMIAASQFLKEYIRDQIQLVKWAGMGSNIVVCINKMDTVDYKQ
jgi:translation elongation factor EF-1alpha